ncbi:MAG TPA: nucleoside phosphorylase [Clostridiales bacterium]|nr:nucleoside phosphorylase [Clostridiales bacterium]
MVFIVTALMIEAAPIIKHFKLKKDMSVHKYQVYKNSAIVLIISGVGKVRSAMASVYLLSNHEITGTDIFLNIGFCGAGSTKYPPGSMLLINKITDIDTGKDYYPDVFINQALPREAICCYSRPLHKEDLKSQTEIFCDMESSGIMEAANKFIYAHQVVILKVISDYLTPENLNKDQLQTLLENHMPYIEQIINELQQLNELLQLNEGLNDRCSKFTSKEEKEVIAIISDISDNLRFSVTMKQILFKEAKKAKQKGIDPLKILKPLTETKVNSKVEGKKIFGQLIEKLEQTLV